MTLPTGIVTFLFTDIEGSTRLWESYPEAMKAASSQHDQLMREVIAQHEGYVIKSTGDGFHAVFASATKAVSAALRGQRMLQNTDWGTSEPVRVRMGLHSGEAQLRDNDYYGSTVNRSARLMGVGHGGQVLLSDVTAKLLRSSLPEGVTLVDMGEHRLRDLELPERIYQLNGAGLQAEFPEINTGRSVRHNLPGTLTSFIGRERESAEVKRLLGASRLLTMIGVGGTGKTRLMLHTAQNSLDQYRHGVWLVELAALTDPEQIPGQIAAALNVREIPGRSLQDVLVDYLRHKQSLLLLDNCEHLISASARMAQELMNACPQLTILATSREGLGIGGEIIYQVPSLSIPSTHGAQDIAELMDYEAVRLFIERAKAASTRFEITPLNSTAIVQICQRLDGIPLAIELAAARVRMLSPEQIATRLKDHFRLLTGGDRTALPRQQTLQALIDWSWDLLGDDERILLRRLAVFSGGWNLGAAEAIVHLPEEDELDALEGLFSLVNKSVVIAEQEPGSETRYHLLETIRQYARERLIEAGEIAQMRELHAKYYAHLAYSSREHAADEGMLEWIKMLDSEYSNIRAALEWSVEHLPLIAAEAVEGIGQYFIARSIVEEGIYWSERTFHAALRTIPNLENEAQNDRQAQIAMIRAWQSMLMTMQGGSQQWIHVAEEALALARQSGNLGTISLSLAILGFVSAFAGQTEQAVTYAREGRKIGYEVNNREAIGLSLGILAMVSRFVDDDADEESKYLEELSQWYQGYPKQWIAGNAMLTQGQISLRKGNLSEAISYYEECLQIYEAYGDKYFTNVARSDIGHAFRISGNLERAQEIYRETILNWKDLGNRGAVANQLECFGFIAVEHGGWERATTLLGAAEALREAADTPMLVYEQIEYDELTSKLRAHMQGEQLKAAWESGRGMGLEAAVAYALAEF